MQLTRFKDVTSQKTPFQEWEVLPSKMFLNIDRRFYGTASQPDPYDEEQPLETEVEESEQCASQFKASRGWESNACRTKELASLKSFDETGLMGMVCRHGCPLRYLNIYTGERARHGIALLQSLVKDLPSGTKIRCCYDISCIFGTTVKVS